MTESRGRRELRAEILEQVAEILTGVKTVEEIAVIEAVLQKVKMK